MATALGQGLQSAQLTNGTLFSRRYQLTRTLRFGITEGEQRQLGFYPSQLKLGCAAQALAPTAVIISRGQHGRARWPLGTERLVENCLGLLSLFVFGVTLETLNDPKELSAIPFKPWDFLTYG
jgi:hypothetical protein